MILAIDPGTEKSAFVVYHPDRGTVGTFGHEHNAHLLTGISKTGLADADHMAIEMVASYGMPVGREVFETCVWVGRFIQAFGRQYTKVYRQEVKLHLCKSPRANDSNIRAALLDRFGPGKAKAVGVKKSPGPLYGISGDIWSALAVAVTWADTHNGKLRT